MNLFKEYGMRQTTPNTMRAAAIDRFGGIETITLQTLPVPEVGPEEVLIRVESAGVGAVGSLRARRRIRQAVRNR